MSDILERMRKEKVDQILRTGKTINEYAVYCPHCAKEYLDVWETGLKPNGESEELECGSCEKSFIVTAEVLFSTEKSNA